MKCKLFLLSSLTISLALATTPAPIVAPIKHKSTCVAGDSQSALDYQALKWYQVSAERKALVVQIYKMSEMALKANKQELSTSDAKKCGIILDIDETVLNNSRYAEMKDKTCGTWDLASWNKYANDKKSTALIGTAQFTNYVHSELGCSVNFVSNRDEATQKSTEDLLKSSGIYFDQVLLKKNKDQHDLDKNIRFKDVINGTGRSKIKHPQVIIGYYGDNIKDFPSSAQSTYTNDINSYKKFGKTYFVLPNPVYGSWLELKYKPK